jgi:hypothetical protein
VGHIPVPTAQITVDHEAQAAAADDRGQEQSRTSKIVTLGAG